MRDFLSSIALALIPPWEADPVRIRNWQIWVAVALYMLILVSAWAAGWFPHMFGSGYALASDVADKISQQNQKLSVLQSTVTDIQIHSLREEMRINEISRCRVLAMSSKKPEQDYALRQKALDYASQRIDDGADQYFKLTHQVYQQQPCEVLMVGAGN